MMLANSITIARIILSLSLIWVKPLSLPFAAIYFLCGASDIADGMIARKTNTTSELGAKLDSFADLGMVAIVMAVLLPLMHIPFYIVAWILLIAGIRAVSIGVVFAKFKTFGILHTYTNKMTGLLVFAFPLIFTFSQSDVIMIVPCVAGSLSAVEELVIHLFSNELDINRKSLFVK